MELGFSPPRQLAIPIVYELVQWLVHIILVLVYLYTCTYCTIYNPSENYFSEVFYSIYFSLDETKTHSRLITVRQYMCNIESVV